MANELKSFITCLSLDEEAMSKVLKKMQELGVECINDLQYLKESDLTDADIMKPIYARKLLEKIAGLQSQKGEKSTSSSSDHIKQLPKSDSKLPILSGTINVRQLLNRLTEFPEKLLSSGRVECDQRRKFVRDLVDQVRLTSKHLTKKQFEEIASQVVRIYPQTFEDRIENLRVGTGYDSLMRQLVSRNENLNRSKPHPLKSKEQSPQASTTITGDEVVKNTRKRKSMYNTDIYGCVNWGPQISMDEEEVQETRMEEMKRMYSEVTTDMDTVYNGMKKCFPLQRKHINAGNSLRQLKIDWPYLTEEKVMQNHCHALLGVYLREGMGDMYLKKGARMLKFFRSRQCDHTSLKKYMNDIQVEEEMDNVTALLPAVILCLQAYFGEEESSLFLIVDEMSSTDEIERINEKNWPRLAMLGESAMTATHTMLLVDGHVVGRYTSFLTAFALLFGAYYMFNIEYPAEAAVTLEFAQRCFFGINPGTGSKTAKKKKTSSTHPKVLKLLQAIADFEWKEL